MMPSAASADSVAVLDCVSCDVECDGLVRYEVCVAIMDIAACMAVHEEIIAIIAVSDEAKTPFVVPNFDEALLAVQRVA